MQAELPERLPAFEALDRLAITEMRPPTSPAGVMGPFYRMVRSTDVEPLTYQIAHAVLQRAGQRALIITGLVDEVRFPCGEIDGPIGSIALARALVALGWDVTIIVDAEAHTPVRAVLDLADLPAVTLIAGDFPDLDTARKFGAGFDVVFAVEKLGRNAKGVRHLVWGTPSPAGDPYSDEYVLAAMEAGALTIGIGDNGNEIGFGKLPRSAAQITPRGVECGCPCGAGIFSVTPCDHLLPASVSNLGCYTLAAALALLSGRAELAVSGEEIQAWTECGLDAGLRSGGVDEVDFRGDDGIPVRYVAAHAELIAGVVHQGLLGDAWIATPEH